jgi:hypothetical protein
MRRKGLEGEGGRELREVVERYEVRAWWKGLVLWHWGWGYNSKIGT